MTVFYLSEGELDANRPVSFRLTPNIADFITATGVAGPLTASMVAAARCLVLPQYKLTSLLQAILRDEMITWHRKVSYGRVNPAPLEYHLCNTCRRQCSSLNMRLIAL